MKQPFELDWMGGPSERAFRRIRPGVDDFPWGTLDPSRYPAVLVERARESWTEAAWNEYCTAAAFTELLRTLLEARAPIDLIGVAGDFLADEMLHVELTSRVAMELGGSDARRVDFDALVERAPEGLSPLVRASWQVVRICCVAEAFSVPMLATVMRSAAHPLTRAVLEQIVKDEAPHGVFGSWYLEWAAPQLGPDDKALLAEAALEMLVRFTPFWGNLTSRVVDGVTSEGFRIQDVRELGWADSETYARRARQAVRDEVLAPLARFGIHPDPARVDDLLARGVLR